MSHTAEDVFGILLVFFINAGVAIINYLANNFIIIAIALYFVFIFSRDIGFLRERVDAVAGKVNSIELTLKQLDQRVCAFESGAHGEDLGSKKIEEAIDRRFNYSLTNIYDEEQLLGHEWNYKVEDGHWVAAIYSEKTKKFIVKHFRTNENAEKSKPNERIISDMRHNAEHIYGGVLDNANGMRLRGGIYVPEE